MTDESPGLTQEPPFSDDDLLEHPIGKAPLPGLSDEELLVDVPRVYSTAEAAKFFDRSNQWLYWGMRNGIFVDQHGNRIEPERITKGGRRRFTLPIIRDIALSCYRRGNFDKAQLAEVLRKITMAEKGYDVGIADVNLDEHPVDLPDDNAEHPEPEPEVEVLETDPDSGVAIPAFIEAPPQEVHHHA